MIEKVILDYLTEKLNIPVFTELPPNLPDKFVVIDKTGSKNKDHIITSMVAIQSYDSTKFKTSLLNEKVKEAMSNIIDLNEISKAKLNSDYPFNDISRKRYRYQALYEVVHY